MKRAVLAAHIFDESGLHSPTYLCRPACVHCGSLPLTRAEGRRAGAEANMQSSLSAVFSQLACFATDATGGNTWE